MFKPLFLLIFFMCFFHAQAEHIIGGDFSVQHVEGNTFEGRLSLYRDCNSGGATLDENVEITVRDLVTDEHITDLDFTFTGFSDYIAELGNSCFVPDICLQVGNYTTTFTLPDNPNGYYLTKMRCCRNNSSINLGGTDLGFVFTLDVPDPALQNSSPLFNPFPSEAYFCVNGSTYIDFGATDADGDSLVYSLAQPLNGSSSAFAPNPAVATAKPFAQVPWANGYNTDDQIGGEVPMSIDSETGLITAQPTQLGIFTVAVKVEEYRNGEKIGEIRRELQLASSVCAIDLPSEISTPENDTVFNVLANSEICLDIVATDPNEGDTLFMEATGPLVDGTVYPSASFPPVDSFSTVAGQFCWSPVCENVQDEPHVVTITAFSRGCANEVLITTQNLYFYVSFDDDEPTEIAAPTTPDGELGAAVIELYNPATHCFNFTFDDPNSTDSLLASASSPLLERDEIHFEPQAFSQGEVTLPFCWDVVCADVRDEPYYIDFEVVATNCEVNDTTWYTVPIQVILSPETPAGFQMPFDEDSYTYFIGDDPLMIPVLGNDPDPYDTLTLSYEGTVNEALQTRPSFETIGITQTVSGDFTWEPSCPDVLEKPYTAVFNLNSSSCRKDENVKVEVSILVTTPTKGIILPIQNIFTPNGDGRNDVWTIENKDDPCLLGFETRIWDRWGKEVFVTQDPSFEWSGNYQNDVEAPAGTYFRTIEYFYKDEKQAFEGNIEIVK